LVKGGEGGGVAVLFIWVPGDSPLGEAKRRNCKPARNKRTPRGRPFQTVYLGWSGPTEKRGYFEVNLPLGEILVSQGIKEVWGEKR